MSEQHRKQPEHHHQPHENLGVNQHQERLHQQALDQAEHARHAKSTENLAHIRESVQDHAEEAEAASPKLESNQEDNSWLSTQQSLKNTAYERTLFNTQQKLPKPVRLFSQITHNPVVDKISAVSAHTVARPSGILGGSICALLGSLIFLYYSKHYGFRYNYTLLFVLYAGGFLLGTILELVIWFVHGRKQTYR